MAAAPRPRLSLAWLLGLTILPALLIATILWWVSDLLPACLHDVRGEFPSPDQRLVASLTDEICGGERYTRIDLRSLSEPETSQTLSILWRAPGTHEASLIWTGPDAIVIDLADDVGAAETANEAMGVGVGFR